MHGRHRPHAHIRLDNAAGNNSPPYSGALALSRTLALSYKNLSWRSPFSRPTSLYSPPSPGAPRWPPICRMCEHSGDTTDAPNPTSHPNSSRWSHAASTERCPPSPTTVAPSYSSTSAPSRLPPTDQRTPLPPKIRHRPRLFRHAPLQLHHPPKTHRHHTSRCIRTPNAPYTSPSRCCVRSMPSIHWILLSLPGKEYPGRWPPSSGIFPQNLRHRPRLLPILSPPPPEQNALTRYVPPPPSINLPRRV